MDKKRLFLVSLGHLSCDVNGGALPTLLPFLIAAYSFNYQSAAGLMFALSCLASVIQPLFGWLSDKSSKPWFIPLGVLLAGSGLAAVGFLQNYWAIFAAITLSGVGAAIFHPEAARYANKVSGTRKGAGLSFFSVGGNAGHVVGPLIVVAAVGAFGLRGTAVFGLISIVMAAVLAYQIAHMSGLPQAVVARSRNDSAPGAEPRNNWREFSKLTAVIISRSILFVACNTFIPLYWIHVFGQSKAAAAVALTFFGAFGVCSNVVGGFLSDRFGYITIIRFSYLLLIPIMAAFATASDVRWAFVLLAPLGFALYAPFSSMVVLGQKYLAKNIGFASGVTLGLAISIGGMIAPLLGSIADAYGLPRALQCLIFVAAVGALFGFLLTNSPRGMRVAAR